MYTILIFRTTQVVLIRKGVLITRCPYFRGVLMSGMSLFQGVLFTIVIFNFQPLKMPILTSTM